MKIFFSHPVLAALMVTLVMGISYINDLQSLRMSANEPQGWLADTVAARLAQGALPDKAVDGDQIAIESSSAPFVVIYDSFGTPIAGTGLLNGSLPHIPLNIFDVARQNPDRITWQPEQSVREAIVVEPAAGGFVMAGRSLAYTERQETMLTLRTGIAWLITMLVLFGGSALLERRRKGK